MSIIITEWKAEQTGGGHMDGRTWMLTVSFTGLMSEEEYHKLMKMLVDEKLELGP